MNSSHAEPAIPRHVGIMAGRYFAAANKDLAARVDRMLACLLLAEWIGLILLCLLKSPFTWVGSGKAIHPHLWAAFLAGPAFIIPVMTLAWRMPSAQLTRHAVAVAQMLVSSLLIDISGGRIESHFHIFGSLAFLAFYRDWKVLITASTVMAFDHGFRGWWYPESVYGVSSVDPWRWMEHTWWVCFEDVFLMIASQRSLEETRAVALTQAWLHAGAYHDPLTGLPNRRLLEEAFQAAQRDEAERSRGVLFLDLDRFKEVNNSLGHSAGDKLLMTIAKRLTAVARATDVLARVGGDEFVLFTDSVATPQDALAVGSELLNCLAEPFEVNGQHLLLSASVGVSISPEHGSELAVLREKADQAMYAAKAAGRNQCVLFSDELAGRKDLLRDLRRDLYHSIRRREIQIRFQPIVDHELRVIAFEALARWEHPVRGPIAPSDFIPLAEESGFISALGEWMLREACRACKEWQQYTGHPVLVTANASAIQLEDKEMPETVARILQEFGLDPSLLTLELTETALVRDIFRTGKQLERLRATGVRIALDDFGTGYSSLSYLAGLPADFIKLDKHFATRESLNSKIVLESVIELAHRVGLKVIGEGIETMAQERYLAKVGCDLMQGYLFSEPMTGAEVTDFLLRRSGLCGRVQMLAAATEPAVSCGLNIC